jgi:type IV secretory pathway VirB2 component (pilin)
MEVFMKTRVHHNLTRYLVIMLVSLSLLALLLTHSPAKADPQPLDPVVEQITASGRYSFVAQVEQTDSTSHPQ